jgi:hypothetical protein
LFAILQLFILWFVKINFTKKLSSLPVLAPPAGPDRVAAGVTTIGGRQLKKGNIVLALILLYFISLIIVNKIQGIVPRD